MEQPDHADASLWEGLEVLDADGELVGTCIAVFADTQTGETEWLQVDVVGHAHSFVPAVDATESGGAIRVDFLRSQVLAAPQLGGDDELTKGDEITLYDHYGVPYTDEVSDSRPPDPASAGRAGAVDDAIASPALREPVLRATPPIHASPVTSELPTTRSTAKFDVPATPPPGVPADPLGTEALPIATDETSADTDELSLGADPLGFAGTRLDLPAASDPPPIAAETAAALANALPPPIAARTAADLSGAPLLPPLDGLAEDGPDDARPAPAAPHLSVAPAPALSTKDGSSLAPLVAIGGLAIAVWLALRGRELRARRRRTPAARAERLGRSLAVLPAAAAQTAVSASAVPKGVARKAKKALARSMTEVATGGGHLPGARAGRER